MTGPRLRKDEPTITLASRHQESVVDRSKHKACPAQMLLISDDPATRDSIRQALQVDGIATETFPSRQSIDGIIDTLRKYDVIVIDSMLLGISSIEICRRIRSAYPLFDLPVLMLTGAIPPVDTISALSEGANDTLTVPFEASELRARVRNLLRMKSSAADYIRSEMAFLQTQFRPHFLFNTLNSIAALSEEDQDGMRRLLNRFGTYLRESFRFHLLETLIPLKRELELVRAYLEIEKIRFGDRLTVTLDIGVDAENLLIPPFTIQPLVENAVRHGLMTRRRGGSLEVIIKAGDGNWNVIVRDDGVGIPRSAIPIPAPGRGNGSIGLQHVERRLRQVYGTGLSISSEPDSGSTVTFQIPMVGG